jgi:hypothetical protein
VESEELIFMFFQKIEFKILTFLLLILGACWPFLTVPNLSAPRVVYFSFVAIAGLGILMAKYGDE